MRVHADQVVQQPSARDEAASSQRLRDRRVMIPSHGELDRLADLLESEGAITTRCPLMEIVEASDPEPVETWVRVLVSGRFHSVIFLSAEGVVRLAAFAGRAGIEPMFVEALKQARIVTRGTRPACALHDLGVPVEVRSTPATTTGVIESLRPQDLAGQHVGVQLLGDDPARDLVDHLTSAGAHVHTVAPYRYAPSADDDRVHALIAQIGRGELDAVVFTAAPQVERLFQVAQERDLPILLRAGLDCLLVAAVGPAVVACLERFGVRVDAAPPRQFFVRRLVETLADRLGAV
jgi:uroporphyrinogen-III synthase